MHSFTDLVERSFIFSQQILADRKQRIVAEDLTGSSSAMVKNLQMIQLQKAIWVIGIFSYFEAILQDRLEVKNGFAEAKQILINNDSHSI